MRLAAECLVDRHDRRRQLVRRVRGALVRLVCSHDRVQRLHVEGERVELRALRRALLEHGARVVVGQHRHRVRDLLLRVLLGPEEGSEFVLPFEELAGLEGGPGVGSDELPVSVGFVAARRGRNRDCPDQSVVEIEWEGGGRSLLSTAELRARAVRLARGGDQYGSEDGSEDGSKDGMQQE